MIDSGTEIKCTFCGAAAIYKYGRIGTGKQRYLCIMCGKQFTLPPKKQEWKNKPFCPKCGSIHAPVQKRKRNRPFSLFAVSRLPFI
jgi:transposase-like protein